jgi:hypothetical protein
LWPVTFAVALFSWIIFSLYFGIGAVMMHGRHNHGGLRLRLAIRPPVCASKPGISCIETDRRRGDDG